MIRMKNCLEDFSDNFWRAKMTQFFTLGGFKALCERDQDKLFPLSTHKLNKFCAVQSRDKFHFGRFFPFIRHRSQWKGNLALAEFQRQSCEEKPAIIFLAMRNGDGNPAARDVKRKRRIKSQKKWHEDNGEVIKARQTVKSENLRRNSLFHF